MGWDRLLCRLLRSELFGLKLDLECLVCGV